MEVNQSTYNKEDVIAEYDQMNFLFKAEEIIFTKYNSFLKESSVLDIGIGAGRTTNFLAKLCKAYVGVDYSQNFINHCKKKLSVLQNASFEFADARSMPQFADNSFDFILFSFNGIDYIDIEGRNLVLKECKRVLKDGGTFCFSFHNFNTIPKLYSLYLSRNPFKWRAYWRRYKMVNKLNPEMSAFANKDYVILRDGGDNFELDTMYMKPEVQLQAMNDAGFESASFYDAEKGSGIPVLELHKSKAQWIYAVIKIKK